MLAVLVHGSSAWALNPDRQIRQFAHNAWTIQEGFLAGTPFAITQTTDGYLWIGTEAGLVRFDGIEFDASNPIVQKQPEYSSAQVGSLLGARDGSLWISTGTDGRGGATLRRWIGNELVNYPLVGTYGPPVIAETRSGDIWLASPFCQVVGPELKCHGKAEGLPEMAGASMTEDTQGHLWRGGIGGLLRWSPSESSVYEPRGLKQFVDGGVYALAAAPDGSLWVGMSKGGTGMGLQHLADGKWSPVLAPGLDSSQWQVNRLLLDRDGALWVGTRNEGLYHLNGQRVDHYRNSDGLSGDFVLGLFQDHEGNLWVLTDGGIDRFRETKVTTFSFREGMCSLEAVSLLVRHDGTLWVGGEGAVSAMQANQSACTPAITGASGDQFTSLFEDSAHQLWVGINDSMNIYEHDHFTAIKRADGSNLGMIVSVAEDVDHNVWLVSGGQHRALFRIENRKVTGESTFEGMSPPHEVAADPGGGLWLGLMNGDLARYRNGRAEVVHFERSADSVITQVAVGSDGSVLAASGSGLLGLRSGKRRMLTTRNGLPCDSVDDFITDDAGSLWLHLHCGFVEITRAQLKDWWNDPTVVLKLRVLDALDGMQQTGAWFQSVSAKTADGRLWFGGKNLQMIDPRDRRSDPVLPPVYVRRLIADQKRFPLTHGLELPALTRNIEIDYAALIFSIPQRARYRYRLEGSDHDWQDAGARREALYTNLGPGPYTFRVIASAGEGAWNPVGASVKFTIPPAFYQTRWFFALCAIGCVALLASVYRIRVRQVASQVRGRMEARLAERERIARDLHDTLLQGMQGLIWRFQAATDRIPPGESARQLMEQSLDRADKLLAESRDKVKDLRPSASNVADLASTLAAEGEQFAQLHHASFRVSVHGVCRELHPIVREEGFLIGREALANAFRHAAAEEIEAEVTYDDRALHVRIRDDGEGIGAAILDAGGKPGHFGLIGMRERAKKLGAYLEVWSKPGAGTEVDLRVPAAVAYTRSETRIRGIRARFAVFRSSTQKR